MYTVCIVCVSAVRVCVVCMFVVCVSCVIEFRLCRATRELIPVQIPFLFFARTNIFSPSPRSPFSSFDISSDFVFVFGFFVFFFVWPCVRVI